jgi:hypothetical protein
MVTIVPRAASILVSPPYASLTTGDSEVITASVVDTSNAAVTWSVNGVVNGNSVLGTIVCSGTGLATYIAPAFLPSANPVTITAAGAADSSKSGSASITIYSCSGIVLSSIDKTSLAPFNLLTITGSGFDPQASPAVNFSDSTGYSVNVSPVSIGQKHIGGWRAPYINVTSDELAAGSVSIHVSQISEVPRILLLGQKSGSLMEPR